MPAPAWTASGTFVDAGDSTTVTLSLTGITRTAGQVLLARIEARGNAVVTPADASWLPVPGSTAGKVANDATIISLHAFYLIDDGSTSYGLGFSVASGGGANCGQIDSYGSGYNPTQNPWDLSVVGLDANGTASTSPVSPAGGTTDTQCLVIIGVCNAVPSATEFTAPSGYTIKAQGDSTAGASLRASLAVATKTQSAAGAVPAATWTSAGSSRWASFTLCLVPAAGGGGGSTFGFRFGISEGNVVTATADNGSLYKYTKWLNTASAILGQNGVVRTNANPGVGGATAIPSVAEISAIDSHIDNFMAALTAAKDANGNVAGLRWIMQLAFHDSRSGKKGNRLPARNATNGHPTFIPGASSRFQGMACYYDYVKGRVLKYGPGGSAGYDVDEFELHNEPNTPTGNCNGAQTAGKMNPADFYEILRAGSMAVADAWQELGAPGSPYIYMGGLGTIDTNYLWYVIQYGKGNGTSQKTNGTTPSWVVAGDGVNPVPGKPHVLSFVNNVPVHVYADGVSYDPTAAGGSAGSPVGTATDYPHRIMTIDTRLRPLLDGEGYTKDLVQVCETEGGFYGDDTENYDLTPGAQGSGTAGSPRVLYATPTGGKLDQATQEHAKRTQIQANYAAWGYTLNCHYKLGDNNGHGNTNDPLGLVYNQSTGDGAISSGHWKANGTQLQTDAASSGGGQLPPDPIDWIDGPTNPTLDTTPTWDWSLPSTDPPPDSSQWQMAGPSAQGSFVDIGSATTFTVPAALTPGDYTFRVRVYDGANYSDVEEWPFTVISPSAPSVTDTRGDLKNEVASYSAGTGFGPALASGALASGTGVACGQGSTPLPCVLLAPATDPYDPDDPTAVVTPIFSEDITNRCRSINVQTSNRQQETDKFQSGQLVVVASNTDGFFDPPDIRALFQHRDFATLGGIVAGGWPTDEAGNNYTIAGIAGTTDISRGLSAGILTAPGNAIYRREMIATQTTGRGQEVAGSVALNHLPTGDHILVGGVVRFQNDNNYVLAGIDVSPAGVVSARIQTRIAGSLADLVAATAVPALSGYTYNPGDVLNYWVRSHGDHISVWVWMVDDRDVDNPTIDASSSALIPSGALGIVGPVSLGEGRYQTASVTNAVASTFTAVSGGPYWPGEVGSDRYIRFGWRWSGATKYEFTGTLNEIEPSWPAAHGVGLGDDVVTLNAGDVLSAADVAPVNNLQTPSEDTGSRILRVCHAVGLPVRADSGISTLVSELVDQTTALAGCEDCIDTEQGQVYADGEGNLAFDNRHHRMIEATDPVYEFTETDYVMLDPSNNNFLVFNHAEVTAAGDTNAQVSDNAASQRKHRVRVYPSIQSKSADVNEAINLANYLTDRYGFPSLRLGPISVAFGPTTAPPAALLQALFGIDIGSRVTASRITPHGAAITLDEYVEGKTFTLSLGAGGTVIWSIQIETTPAIVQQYWVLGHPVLGQLGVTTRLAF